MRVTRPARRSAWVLAAPLVLASLLSGLAPARASAAACHPGPVTQPLSPADQANQLNGVAVLSPCNVWVAGFTRDSTLGQRTLIEHWNGSAWTVVPSPHPGTLSQLNSVRAFSPTSIWAVGEFGRGDTPGLTDKTLVLHYNGTSWKQVPSPSPGLDNNLNGVRWVSAKDAWAVGSKFDGTVNKTLILRWNGHKWATVTSPNPAPGNLLSGVAATSSKDAWAVGQIFSGIAGPFRGSRASAHAASFQRTFILHWNGTAWKRANSPSPAAASRLDAVGVTGPASAWAVGVTEKANNTGQTLAMRWNGHKWATVTTPAGPAGAFRELTGVAAVSARDAWAVGVGSRLGTDQAIVLHWNGTKWMPVSLTSTLGTETELLNVAGSAGNVWAVGDSAANNDPTQALVFHCC